jgi:hypothetical protein
LPTTHPKSHAAAVYYDVGVSLVRWRVKKVIVASQSDKCVGVLWRKRVLPVVGATTRASVTLWLFLGLWIDGIRVPLFGLTRYLR